MYQCSRFKLEPTLLSSHGLGFNEMVCHWVSHRVGQGATGQDVLASKEM